MKSRSRHGRPPLSRRKPCPFGGFVARPPAAAFDRLARQDGRIAEIGQDLLFAGKADVHHHAVHNGFFSMTFFYKPDHAPAKDRAAAPGHVRQGDAITML